MNVYPLSMTRDYVASWGLSQAIRELVQNALDSERPFVYEFDRDGDGTYCMSVHSAGVTLPPSMLLLGKTTKRDDAQAIGQFGEGLKLALLVLTRLDRHVIVRNGSVDWMPSFDYSDAFGDEVLTVHEVPTYRSNDDLTIEVYSLTQDDVDDIVRGCLLMQSSVGSKTLTDDGEILLDRPGTLYVGNLYVCDTKMLHGYNVRSDRLKLDRDRQTVGSWDLDWAVLKMWIDTKDWAKIAEMIDAEVPDMAATPYYPLPEELRKACYDLFRRNNPNSLVALSDTERARLERTTSGRVVRVNGGMYAAITGYGPYTERPKVLEMTPKAVLERFRSGYSAGLEIGGLTEAFDELVEASVHWRNA